MRAWELLREAAASARAQKVPSVLVAALVAAMCLTTLVTVGRTASAERQVQQRLEEAGSRQLRVVDAEAGGLLTPTVVGQIRGLSTVERAVAFGDPTDVTNGAVGDGGPKVPAWTVTGDLEDVVQLVAGRWPAPGEGLVSEAAQHALGMDAPIGYLTGDRTQIPVVGAFAARSPFGEYAAGALVASAADAPARTLHVIVRSAAAAKPTQATVLGLIAPPDLDSVTVQSPAALADLQAEVSADLGTYGRSLVFGVLGAGALLIAVVVLADVLVRRTDLGRRRALGATRGALLALVVLRNLAPALTGAAVGTAVGLAAADRWNAVPPASFTAGTAVLAILTAVLCTVPPAAFAATRDPVRVLRTP